MRESVHSIFQEFNDLTKQELFWKERTKTIIYGAGNTGKDVFRVLRNNGIHISGFLDKKAKQDTYWDGVPIYQPNDRQFSADERKKTNVIVAIHNRDVEIPPIIAMLRSIGYGRVVTLIEPYDHFGRELGERFWLTSRAYYRSFEPFIEEAFNLWEDDISKNIYKAIIQFRLTGDYNALPKPDMEHQYFPPDLPAWKTPLRFVDCGAFDGDTLSYLIKNDIPIEAVAAFEPDQGNFDKLSQFVKNNLTCLKNVTLWPCGVHSSTKQMRFSSGKGEASLLNTTGDVVIQCLSLDDVIPDFAPTLIKMDIEGAEYEALLGAREIISKYRPGLAISLYHRPADLWQIPLLVNEIIGGGTNAISECTHSTDLKRSCMELPNNGSYKYFLRSHGFNGFDLIMYAMKV
ncbi:MAG: FkbM family methyltransferase [Syntrophales bacterium]|jgi:FkbM family methyltransferase|nr:FkbM family methyltransferase [Syntrophales bacterium]